MAQRLNALAVTWLTLWLGASVAFASENRWCGPVFQTGPLGSATIFGTLREYTKLGPPTFGENPKSDIKVKVWVVHLDVPIPVEVDRELKLPPKLIVASDIQIVMSPAISQLLPEYRNRHIRIAGRLWSQAEWQDFTAVVIAASIIREAGRSDCSGREIRAPI